MFDRIRKRSDQRGRLPELQARGLIDARAHKTTAPGCSTKSDTVNDGTLWCVRLNPDEGTPAKLTYDDMNHDGWRDLNRNRKRGRTAHRAVKEHREKRMQQSQDSPQEMTANYMQVLGQEERELAGAVW